MLKYGLILCSRGKGCCFNVRKYDIGLYEKAMPADLPWAEKLKIAKEHGYDFIELSIDVTDEKLARLDWTAQERLELVTLMNKIGLPIRSICLSSHRKYPIGSSDPTIREKGMEIMRKAITLADDLGIRIVQLAGYDVYSEESTMATKELFLKNLQESVALASRKGVTLGFETMETDFMNTVGKIMDYIQLVDCPYLGVYPDTGNLTNAALTNGMDLLDDLRKGKGHLLAFHLKESLPGRFGAVPYLTGHVDFSLMIEAAWQLGVRRYVTELWDTGAGTWQEDIQFAIHYMTSILDKQMD